MATQSKGHILIVDDAVDIQMLLGQLLETEGFRVSNAENGKDALMFLRSASPLPDLIMLDLMMPEMDGFQFRIEQKKESKLAAIPVIVMTADISVRSRAQIGANGFLKKPFSSLDLILSTVTRNLA